MEMGYSSFFVRYDEQASWLDCRVKSFAQALSTKHVR